MLELVKSLEKGIGYIQLIGQLLLVEVRFSEFLLQWMYSACQQDTKHPNRLACLLACLFVSLLACLLVCLHACVLAGLLACTYAYWYA